MYTDDELKPLNSLNPIFEGFAIQMRDHSQKQKVRELIASELGSGWNISSFGDSATDDYAINFEVIPKEVSLSVEEAWKTTYRLRTLPGIVYAEPLFTVSISNRPDWSDNSFQLEVAFDEARLNETIDLELLMCGSGPNFPHIDESNDREWSLKQLRVFEAWERFFPDPDKPPGHGIIIGHPDTGYRPHPEIKDNLLLDLGFDFLKCDENPIDELEKPFGVFIPNPGHGTSIASVIISPKGQRDNDPHVKAVTGVAPGAKLIPLRTSYSVVLLSMLNLARAIEYATDKGAHVISISMGGLFCWRLRHAITYAQRRGVIVAAAAGNCVRFVVWPAAYDEVIAVAASNVQRQIWRGSSRGSKVDVTAPGESVWHAQVMQKNDGELEYLVQRGSGTSFAVAAVAGVAALWLSYHGRDQLIQRYGVEKIPFIFNRILRESCDRVPIWEQGKFGAGLVNVEKVLAAELPGNDEGLMIAPAFDLEEHVPLDNGGHETFALR